MSVRYSNVVIEDVLNNKLSENDLALLVDIFRRTVLKVKAMLATKAEFSLKELPTVKRLNDSELTDYNLVIYRLIQNDHEFWVGEIEGGGVQIIGSID